jgi:uncharacterized membrane protein
MQKFRQKVNAERGESPCNLYRRNSMLLEPAAKKPNKINYTAIGIVIGVGIALLLSELGFEVEMSVGFVFGLAIGAYLDKRKKENRV